MRLRNWVYVLPAALVALCFAQPGAENAWLVVRGVVAWDAAPVVPQVQVFRIVGDTRPAAAAQVEAAPDRDAAIVTLSPGLYEVRAGLPGAPPQVFPKVDAGPGSMIVLDCFAPGLATIQIALPADATHCAIYLRDTGDGHLVEMACALEGRAVTIGRLAQKRYRFLLVTDAGFAALDIAAAPDMKVSAGELNSPGGGGVDFRAVHGGKAIPGAGLYLRRTLLPDLEVVFHANADASGAIHFPLIPAGDYAYEAKAPTGKEAGTLTVAPGAPTPLRVAIP